VDVRAAHTHPHDPRVAHRDHHLRGHVATGAAHRRPPRRQEAVGLLRLPGGVRPGHGTGPQLRHAGDVRCRGHGGTKLLRRARVRHAARQVREAFGADFWAELVLFPAPSSNAEVHCTRRFSREAGEFITHLWALLIHAGILERHSSSTAEANAAGGGLGHVLVPAHKILLSERSYVA
jgi:hypothetical protein